MGDHKWRSIWVSVMVGWAALAAPLPSAQAQESFDKFQTYNDANAGKIDYSAYDTLMDRFSFKKSRRVNVFYAGLRPQGVIFLNQFSSALSRLKPTTLSRDEQLAYWLNLRNILILRAIAAEDPGRTIKSERGTFTAPGEMWTRKRLTVEDVPLSIADIEQEILLKNFADDPYVLYGLYQGAKGGPALNRKAFKGPTVREMLKSIGADYVNGRRTLRVKSDKVTTSPIYFWYKEAFFGADDAAVISHINALASKKLQKRLAEVSILVEGKFDYNLDEHVVRQQRQFDNAGGIGRSAPSSGGS